MHRRRNMWGLSAAWVLALCGPMLMGVPASAGKPPPTTPSVLADFSAPGSYAWTVPKGIIAVSVNAFGASGGLWVLPSDVGPSGLGGQLTGVLPVKPGQVLQIVVGGAGRDASEVPAPDTGGFNGGGKADPDSVSSGGGGASDVRVGDCATTKSCTFADRVLVAAGGGGLPIYSFRAGDGGGFTGGSAELEGLYGGGGATQEAGGGVGERGLGSTPGTFGTGGDAGESGAGGGGGWFGGGGGGNTLGGGGGGSSYLAPGLSGSTTPGVNVGNGRVTIARASAASTANKTATINPNGYSRAFVVPFGVRSLKVTLAGGAGADADASRQAVATYGGHGALVKTTLAVTAGQVLTLNAGEAGPAAKFGMPAGSNASDCQQAFGGGGIGGWQQSSPDALPWCGPGGGGATDIRTSPSLASRLVVAGGGGSSAQESGQYINDVRFCSWSGGDSGSNGLPVAAECAFSPGGGSVADPINPAMPGTAFSGGAASTFNWPGITYCGDPDLGIPYTQPGNGTIGQGGRSGYYTIDNGRTDQYSAGVGGAGGGGYYGGGGGTAEATQYCQGFMSGGAGGSSYLPPKVKGSSLVEGANEGAGYVTIAW